MTEIPLAGGDVTVGDNVVVCVGDQAAAWVLPVARRRGRLRILCDGCSLEPDERIALLDVVAHLNRPGFGTHHRQGSIGRRPSRREIWDAGGGNEILAGGAWFEAHRSDLLAFLR